MDLKLTKFVFSLVFGLTILIGLMWFLGFGNLWNYIRSISVEWLIVSALTIVPMNMLRSWRWRLILLSMKKNFRFSTVFWAISIGFMANTFSPIRLGELVRAYIFRKKEKIKLSFVLSSIVIERTLDLIGLLTIGLITLFLIPYNLETFTWFADGFKLMSFLIAIIIVIFIVSIKKETRIIAILTQILSMLHLKLTIRNKVILFIKSIIEGARLVSNNPKLLLFAISLTLAYWSVQFIGLFLMFKAFSFDVPIILVLFGSLIINLSFLVPAAPGHVGTYEAFFVLIFIAIGLNNTDQLLAIGVVQHLVGLATTLILGSAGIIWFGMSFKEIFKVRPSRKT